jgi:hypothetical protein
MHTPEQRDKHELCGAKKRSDGKPCRKFAGEGTDHFGIGRCRLHGGSTRTHRVGAEKVQADRVRAKFGAPKKVLPGDALMEMLWIAYGQVYWLQAEIDRLDDTTTLEAMALIRAHRDERDRCARVAATALDAGVAERQVRVMEMYAEAIGRLLKGILTDLRLTPAQDKIAPEVVRRNLLAIEGKSEDALELLDGKTTPVGQRR